MGCVNPDIIQNILGIQERDVVKGMIVRRPVVLNYLMVRPVQQVASVRVGIVKVIMMDPVGGVLILRSVPTMALYIIMEVMRLIALVLGPMAHLV